MEQHQLLHAPLGRHRIPPEERGRIFERFYRASAQGEGAGLGLSIGDAVVRATGGVWEVTTSPLGGARLAVRWPPSRRRLLFG